MAEEVSITDIFQTMSVNDSGVGKKDGCNVSTEKITELLQNLNINVHKTLGEVIENARKAQQTWECCCALERAEILHKIGTISKEKHLMGSHIKEFQTRGYGWIREHFSYYSHVCFEAERDLNPIGVVLVILLNDASDRISCLVISAALAAGCSVIVLYSIKNPIFFICLKQIFSDAGLSDDLFTLVENSDENEEILKTQILHKIVVFGDHISAQHFYERSLFKSFSFVNVNNTATYIFESCDIESAAFYIFFNTWDKFIDSMWGVSTAVVQESVYTLFLKTLKSTIDKLADEQERLIIKKSIILEEGPNQETEPGVPVLKVLSCRTAKEGVTLLNNSQYYLGVSIWSQNTSQAFQVASKLICNNIWFNCHGISRGNVPLQPLGYAGRGVFGGYEGILEYKTFPLAFPTKSENNPDCSPEKLDVGKIVLSAQEAFKKWCLEENKNIYLGKVANNLKYDNNLFSLSKVVTEACCSTVNINLLRLNSVEDYYVLHSKIPVGVIAIVFHSSYIDLQCITYLVTAALTFGNAIILLIEEDNSSLELILNHFITVLPKGLISVINAKTISKPGIALASNPFVQALWLYDAPNISTQSLQSIKRSASKTLKHIWLIPKILSISHNFFQKECLRSRIIWLDKTDWFPEDKD